METRAVIDIGTNSVKLLVAEWDDHAVHPLIEKSAQTRLGRGFYETHVLQPAPILETAQAVAEFAAEARAFHCRSIRVIATSAARDAKNPGDLIEAVRQASGLTISIITGENEAAMVYTGVSTAPGLHDVPLLVFDIGGGSTEVILGHEGKKTFEHSFPVGSVRLMEAVPHSDPPDPADWTHCSSWLEENFARELRSLVQPVLRTIFRIQPRLIGTGGTSSILARIHRSLPRFDREIIERTVLSLGDVVAHRRHLWSMPLAARRELVGLPPDRADVILTGVAILETMMQALDFVEFQTSTRGLRFGAILAADAGNG